MWNTTPSEQVGRVRARLTPALAAFGLILATGCSQASEAGGEQGAPKAAATPAPAPVASAPSPVASATPAATSQILGKHDLTVRSKAACRIEWAYADRDPEDLIWEEPCSAVTAKLVTESDLKALNRWTRLDDFARKFVAALPGGQVLYVEGGFSASVYPVGTDGTSYEVSVTD